MKRQLTLKNFEEEVMKLDPKTGPDDPVFSTAVFMLAALQVGANADRVAKFCGYRRDYVRERARRLREAKVWVGGKTNCEWFEENGGIAFWCDVLVAEGLLDRSN